MDVDPSTEHRAVPLVVDMESALFITGLVIEALLVLARHAPMKALLACLNLFGGYRRFRESLLATAGFEVATLPENTKLVELLQAQASTGRPIRASRGIALLPVQESCRWCTCWPS